MTESQRPRLEISVDNVRPDPFNHGTSSVVLEDVSPEVFEQFHQVLQTGWDITDVEGIQQVERGPEINSRNFRIDTDQDAVLLKLNRANDPATQDLINRSLLWCEQQEIPVPHLIPTRKDKSYFVLDGKVYSLYEFIKDGENFDGSQEELLEVADQLPRFTSVLAETPVKDQLRRTGRVFVHHDRERLMQAADAIKAGVSGDPFLEAFKDHLDEILETSKTVSGAFQTLQNLPAQIVHRDVTPHNVLFDQTTQTLIAFLDFDPIEDTQRIRGVAFALHRFARTFGERTERKHDLGGTIEGRASLFLESYLRGGDLTVEEVSNIPLILRDETLRRILHVLDGVLRGNHEWVFDLPKQLTVLKEVTLLDNFR